MKHTSEEMPCQDHASEWLWIGPVTVALLVAPLAARAVDTTVVPAGAVWKFLDDGSNQGTAWIDPLFSDAAWSSGPAQLGYGDGDEATVISFGPNANAKFITSYFRHTFNVADASVLTTALLRVVRDDGAIVYLNGTEVFRTNMPVGTITYQRLASSAVSGADESLFNEQYIDPAMLVTGSNVLAVEIHQSSGTSSDLSFDLEFTVSDAPPVVVRGPYLQQTTSSGTTLRWRTNGPTDSRVSYGLATGSLGTNVDDPTSTTEHEVAISGLDPATTYFYAVGSSTATMAGDDADHFFVTAPAVGATTATRVWVIGDSGTADANAAAVRDAYLAFAGLQNPDFWLMLGDNAYSSGTDTEYQAAVFDMYPTILRQTAVWPTLGNHDGINADSFTETGVYYDVFTLPRNAEAGGMASGTEAYYSFDYANIHFICLDSHDTTRSVGAPMMTWLAADAGDTLQDWIIAFWHHPPYTKGSHDSDDLADSGGRMEDMREIALPILEAAGVDLVLSGHSHSYERSFLLDGHYGMSGTLTSAMLIDDGDGRDDGLGIYVKPSTGTLANQGAVYAVAGSSGKISGGPLNHPAMYISLNSLGSLVLDIDGDRLDATFVDSTGATADYFTIIKAPGQVPGDYNGDANVDLTDHGYWPTCITGPNNGPYAADCAPFDFEADRDLDLDDYRCLQITLTAP